MSKNLIMFIARNSASNACLTFLPIHFNKLPNKITVSNILIVRDYCCDRMKNAIFINKLHIIIQKISREKNMHDHCMISMIANQGKHVNEQAPSSCVLLLFGSGKPTIVVRLDFAQLCGKIV